MIKRVLHFSDLHVRLFKDHEQYRNILKFAFKEWDDLNIDRIVFTGDLVHSKNQMTPELIDFVAWTLTECAKISKTIIIPGNHDMVESNLTRLDALSPIIQSINNPNIVYYKDRGVYEDENINWCVYSLFQHNLPPEINNTHDKTYIGLFHGPIQGLYTDIGYKFEDGYDKSKFSGCDIVLCGDIHKRQTIYLNESMEINSNVKNSYQKKGWGMTKEFGNNRVQISREIPIIQVGSFIQQNFGEKTTNHGYGIYDVMEDDYSFVDVPNSKPFLSFFINSIDCLEEGSEKLVNY